MSTYTQQQILAAKRADIKSFLESHGEKLTRKGSEYLWEKHQVWINGSSWYSHYEEVGGHAVDFVKRFYGLPFRDAVRELTGKTVQGKKTKAVLVPLLYRILGKKFVYPIIAKAEYDAAKTYEPVAARFSSVQSIKDDEQRHGDTVNGLL